MPRSRLACRFLAGAAAVAALAGCATPQSRADAYERSLAHWQGASEASLREAWGPPVSEEKVDGSTTLVYVTDEVSPVNDHPTAWMELGAFGWGVGHAGAGGGIGLTAPLPARADARRCTTRFLVHAGRIESWSFEGDGCGAPAL